MSDTDDHRQHCEDHVRSYYELVDNDDVAGLLDLFAPDATYRRPGYDDLRGRSGLEAFYRHERIIESGRHTVLSCVVEQTEAFVRGSFVGTLTDGSSASLEFADYFSFDDARLIERRQSYFFAPLV